MDRPVHSPIVAKAVNCVELGFRKRPDIGQPGAPSRERSWYGIAVGPPDQRPAPRRLLDLAAEVVSVIGLEESAHDPGSLPLARDERRGFRRRVNTWRIVRRPPSTQGLVAEVDSS
jgi:hypothetical protein